MGRSASPMTVDQLPKRSMTVGSAPVSDRDGPNVGRMTTSTGTQVPPVTAGLGSPGAEHPEEACAREVDGLFTYCLSVLCDHDAALDALRSVRDMAVRHHDRLRDPALM